MASVRPNFACCVGGWPVWLGEVVWGWTGGRRWPALVLRGWTEMVKGQKDLVEKISALFQWRWGL